MRPVLILLAALTLLAGCKRENMYAQRYYRSWNQNSFFASGTAMLHPPAGVVARIPYQAEVPAPAVVTPALLERGQERYDIFCTPCHGRTGAGRGMIVQRGFPQPPSLVEGSLRTADNKVLYDAITKGYGAMYPLDTRVAPPDRWAIVAYIRALQRSQNTAVASLPAELRADLDASR